MNPVRRIQKEINDIRNDKETGITVEPIDASNIRKLVGTFPGPEGSPYEGGTFKVDIDVVEGYPFQPLKMKFITKVYHPNISSQSGAICLDILTPKAWTPVLTLRSTLVSLRSLLCSPEPDDPQDAQVAAHYKSNKSAFEETARFWTDCYAKDKKGNGGGGGGGAKKIGAPQAKTKTDPVLVAGLRHQDVDKFTAMGFTQEQVISVLAGLNASGQNVQNLSEDSILNALFAAAN